MDNSLSLRFVLQPAQHWSLLHKNILNAHSGDGDAADSPVSSQLCPPCPGQQRHSREVTIFCCCLYIGRVDSLYLHMNTQTHRGYCCSASIEAITFSTDVTSVGGLTPKVLHLHAGEVYSDSELSDSGFWDRKTWEIWKINLDPDQWREKNMLSTVY